MDFPIHIYAISMGLSILHLKGSQIEFSMTVMSVPEACLSISKTVLTLMKCSIMLHFILVFAVCQSNHLGVSPNTKG